MIFKVFLYLSYVCNALKTGNTFSNSKPKILTAKQEKYSQLLEDKKISLVVVHGPAGTGKSWLAVKTAIEKLKDNSVKKIVLTRPIVSVEDENLGFLPGNIDDKMNPWIQPLYDIFNDEKSNKNIDINSLVKSGKIEIIPIGFMRGRTFTDTYVIADEMQNSSPLQMKMILTRMGENSKIIVTGDSSQCDLKIKENGLIHFLKVINNYFKNKHEIYNNGIGIVKLDIKDVKRSPLAQTILDIYSSPSPELEDNQTIMPEYLSKPVQTNCDCCCDESDENTCSCLHCGRGV